MNVFLEWMDESSITKLPMVASNALRSATVILPAVMDWSETIAPSSTPPGRLSALALSAVMMDWFSPSSSTRIRYCVLMVPVVMVSALTDSIWV